MAAVLGLCGGLGKRKFTRFPTAFVCLTNSGTRAVLWRSCSQCKQVTSSEDLVRIFLLPFNKAFATKTRLCLSCLNRLLSQFISPFTGCIYGRHITGLCGKKQREITKAIKRAQILGFMPVTYKDPAYLKDPKVCNIRYRE
uniref:Small ribosomal subunit protein bS18m n=1 Tax=Bos taurus TaxID=9913 RepID=A0A3Q1N6A9_BOVIN